jgi:hypothetical protein
MMPPDQNATLNGLTPLVGTWTIEIAAPSGPVTGQATFAWLPGGGFLIQTWETPTPYPSGIAVIGAAQIGQGFTQSYFDNRGVARVYQMGLSNGVWTLGRQGPDFPQRFTGTISADQCTITGTWERSDDGATWTHDFDMTYQKVS